MADISTPATARKTEEFTLSQIELVRTSLGIADNPLQSDRTYIVFDAASGNNNLHIDTGSSETYSILKGDGSQAVQYTDTGGIKVLNYTNAGRYLITIDGDFQGIDTSGASAGDKNKYIGIIGGSNYPVAIVDDVFLACINLEFAIFKTATSIGDNSFEFCNLSSGAEFPLVTTIGDYTFRQSKIEEINCPLVTTIGDYTFQECLSLSNIVFDTATTIGDFTFNGCNSLNSISFPALITIGANAFNDCKSLVDISLQSVTTIGASAFNDCDGLISISLRNVSNISNTGIFSNCLSLKRIYLPVVTTIGASAFLGLNRLEEVFCENVSTIGANAFNGCNSIEHFRVNYNASLSIGATAFTGVSLSDLHIVGATGGQATTEEAKFTAAGMAQLNGYRLLY